MFYSQFILAKKGPLGTIWIAAHLERKLRKNQVADTDIAVSVDSILFPEVPIALRLSSHLLLGVVRIYSRKVNYLFHDCSEALLKIKQAFRSTAVDLPPEESTAPYHSITLPETFDLDDFELPDTAMLDGNFVDHHISTREQITLQDTLDATGYSTSQFGLDERFGDGDASQIGLDLDEELFLDNNFSLQHDSITMVSEEGALHQGRATAHLTEMDIDEGQCADDEDRNAETSKHLSELLNDRDSYGVSHAENSKRNDDCSHRFAFNIQTPDLNEVFLPEDHTEDLSAVHCNNVIDFAADDPPSPVESANTLSTPVLLEEDIPAHAPQNAALTVEDKISPFTPLEADKVHSPIAQEVEHHSATTNNDGVMQESSIDSKSVNVAPVASSPTSVLIETKPDSVVPECSAGIPVAADGINDNGLILEKSSESRFTNIDPVALSPMLVGTKLPVTDDDILITEVSTDPKSTNFSSAIDVENNDGLILERSTDPRLTNIALVLPSPPLVGPNLPVTNGDNIMTEVPADPKSANFVEAEPSSAIFLPAAIPISLAQQCSGESLTTPDAINASSLVHEVSVNPEACIPAVVTSSSLVSAEPMPDSIGPQCSNGNLAASDVACLESSLKSADSLHAGLHCNAADAIDGTLPIIAPLENMISSSCFPEVSNLGAPLVMPFSNPEVISNISTGSLVLEVASGTNTTSIDRTIEPSNFGNQGHAEDTNSYPGGSFFREPGFNLETTQREKAMHLTRCSTELQGTGSHSTETNINVHQKSDYLLTNLEEQSSRCISKDAQLDQWNCFSSSEFSGPERMLFAPTGYASLPNDLGQSTVEKGVIESDGSVDRISSLSGQKRHLMESTPVLPNGISSKMSGQPRKRRNTQYIPGDDDLLASILVGRTQAQMMGPTPPLPRAASLKRPRLTSRLGTPKRRKALLDDTIVLHADAIRQQLINTEDIRRMRKKAPCTRPEIWRIHKSLIEEDIFSESIFTGISEELNTLPAKFFGRKNNKLSQVNEHHLSTEIYEEMEMFREWEVIRDAGKREMIVQSAVIPDRVDGGMQGPSGTSSVAEAPCCTDAVTRLTTDAQKQLEIPVLSTQLEPSSNHRTVKSTIDVNVQENAGIELVSALNSGNQCEIPVSRIEENHGDACIDPEQNPVDKMVRFSDELTELNRNLVHVTESVSVEEVGGDRVANNAAPASLNGEISCLAVDPCDANAVSTMEDHMIVDTVQAVCSGNLLATLNGESLCQVEDACNDDHTTSAKEGDMTVDMVKAVNLDNQQHIHMNEGKVPSDGALVTMVDIFTPKVGENLPRHSSDDMGRMNSSIPDVALASGEQTDMAMAGDHQSIEVSKAGEVAVVDEPVMEQAAVNRERPTSEVLCSESLHIPSSHPAGDEPAVEQAVVDRERPTSEVLYSESLHMPSSHPAGDEPVVEKQVIDGERPTSAVPCAERPCIPSSLPVMPTTESDHVPSAVGENSCMQEFGLEGGLVEQSTHMDLAAARQSSDFCSAIDDIDTEFLNVDDDAEYDEEEDNDAPNAEEAQSFENSGWSSRTRGVARYLKNMFDEGSGRGRKSVAIDHLLAGKTRKEASRMFFETLVLKTRDYIHVEQPNSFDCINVKPRIKLMKSEF